MVASRNAICGHNQSDHSYETRSEPRWPWLTATYRPAENAQTIFNLKTLIGDLLSTPIVYSGCLSSLTTPLDCFSKFTRWRGGSPIPPLLRNIHRIFFEDSIMPVVRVSWFEGKDTAAKKAVAAEITESIVKNTGTDPKYIYVIFEDIAPSDWAGAGQLFGEGPKPS
jgi:4-oxalocrotonate tautomerase